MTRVAVIGSRGQLGTDVVAVLRAVGDYQIAALTREHIDVTDPASVHGALTAARPAVVVNCAAFVRVDECEERPEEAFRVNALGAGYVARTCAELGARCVHVSTDYVFSGAKAQPYTEEDAPSPVNVYGASKLAGEHLVRQRRADALIVRVAGTFGTAGASGKGGNFVETILRQAKGGEVLRVVNDVRISPTYSADAAAAMERLIRTGITGVVHVTNAGTCTWYDFARTILELTGMTATLVPVASSEYPMKARRPANSALTTVRLVGEGGPPLRRWDDALRAYLAQKGHAAPALPGATEHVSP
jgi:dTDP-4-dehydrorhamnose reductase